MVYYCWVRRLLILDNYMVMLYCPCLRVLNKILNTGHFYNLVILSSSVFCLCRYFLYFFIAGDAGSSSNITSFNTSVICSVDFAGRTLLIGGGQPSRWQWWWCPWFSWFGGYQRCGHLCPPILVVWFEVEGWVRLCVTVVMGFLIRAKTCLAVSSFSFGF